MRTRCWPARPPRRCTKRSAGCPIGIERRSSSATCRGSLAPRLHGGSTGRWGRSTAGSPGPATSWAGAWPGAGHPVGRCPGRRRCVAGRAGRTGGGDHPGRGRIRGGDRDSHGGRRGGMLARQVLKAMALTRWISVGLGIGIISLGLLGSAVFVRQEAEQRPPQEAAGQRGDTAPITARRVAGGRHSRRAAAPGPAGEPGGRPRREPRPARRRGPLPCHQPRWQDAGHRRRRGQGHQALGCGDPATAEQARRPPRLRPRPRHQPRRQDARFGQLLWRLPDLGPLRSDAQGPDTTDDAQSTRPTPSRSLPTARHWPSPAAASSRASRSSTLLGVHRRSEPGYRDWARKLRH